MSYYTTSKGRRVKKETPPVRFTECYVCRGPLEVKTKGRPRRTCSDACRQAWFRRSSPKMMGVRSNRKRLSDAAKALRTMERAAGQRVSDEKTGEHGWLGDRTRLLIRLGMGQIVPQCAVCRMPYLEEYGAKEIYCSEACHKEGHKRAELLLRAKNAWDGDYNPHLDLRVPLGIPVRACENCLKPFSSRNPQKRFCNPTCRKAHWRKTHRRCLHCNTWFERKSSHPTKIYCTPKCRRSADHHTRVVRQRADLMPELMRLCDWCEEPFEVTPSKWKIQRFCGRSCYMKNRWREQPPVDPWKPPNPMPIT